MALYLEFDRIVRAFARAKVRYAVAGGFAVGLHGYIRATQDMDFLVNEDDLSKAEASLARLRYRANPDVQELTRAGLTLKRFFKQLPRLPVSTPPARNERQRGLARFRERLAECRQLSNRTGAI